MRLLSFFSVSALTLSALATGRAVESRRLFDFTPISADNPVVATVAGTIQLPLSELRAYRTGERLQAKTDTPAQKRALLEDLLNEYLLVDEAYRTGVADSARFAKQMEATRTMILTDFLATRAMSERGPTPPDARDAAAALADRLFDAAAIDISNEAYTIIKRTARQLDTASAASNRGPVIDAPEDAAAKLHAIITAAPEAVAVRYEGKSLSIHEILSIYSGLPAPRPAVETPDGFVAMIKPLITPELMAGEAVRRGIADEVDFQNKLAQNRNALLRFHEHGAIEAQANAIIRGPDLDAQLQPWFRAHAAAYATPDAAGEKKIPSYAEARDRALADYSVELVERLQAEKARELRRLRAVSVIEAVLMKL